MRGWVGVLSENLSYGLKRLEGLRLGDRVGNRCRAGSEMLTGFGFERLSDLGNGYFWRRKMLYLVEPRDRTLKTIYNKGSRCPPRQ
jgi:hypothetical protein